MNMPRLTFDDGPSESTEQVLDLLGEHGVRAVFFVIGLRASQRPDLVKQAAADGHTIGNHTWDHVDLTRLSDDQVTVKLQETNDAITEIVGSPPTLFRAPWLQVDDRVLQLAEALGLTHMGRDVDTCDYSPNHGADYVASAILGAEAGQIVLLHDGTGDERGGDKNPPRPKTVEALRQVLPEFAARWR